MPCFLLTRAKPFPKKPGVHARSITTDNQCHLKGGAECLFLVFSCIIGIGIYYTFVVESDDQIFCA